MLNQLPGYQVSTCSSLLTKPVVEDDAGEDAALCPAHGPCNSWSGTHIFNMTTPDGILSIDTMWGPGSGWIIGVISAVGSIIWVILVAVWSGNERMDNMRVENL